MGSNATGSNSLSSDLCDLAVRLKADIIMKTSKFETSDERLRPKQRKLSSALRATMQLFQTSQQATFSIF
jgi:hypothetical protein